VTGKWKKIHNEELYDLHFSPYIVRVITSRRMIWAEHVACIGERRDVYRGLVGKTEGKRRPSSRWEGNVTMNPQRV
jgi:hypothetical protein